MDFVDIPDNFLELPEIINIKEKPTDPYNLSTSGRIHGRKFNRILKFLQSGDVHNWKSEMKDIFSGNYIVDEVIDLKFSQLLDLIIHIAYANKLIDWNSTALIEKYLQAEYNHIPRWEVPRFDFNDDLRSFFSTRISINMGRDFLGHILEIKKLLDDEYDSLYSDRLLRNKLLKLLKQSSNLNLQLYFELIGNLSIIQRAGIVKYEDFPVLMREMEHMSTQVLNDHYLDTPRKEILFIVNYILIFIRDDPQTIESSHNLILRGLKILKRLDDDSHLNYQWLLDSAKVVVSGHIGKYRMELISEDLLIRNISNRFLYPDDVNLNNWLNTVSLADIPIEIYMILLQGYHGVEEILIRYYSQLPDSTNKVVKQLNDFVVDLLESISMKIKGKNKWNFDILPAYSEFAFLEIMNVNNLYQSVIIPDLTSELALEDMVDQSIFTEYFTLYLESSHIISGTYPFDEYISRISNQEEEYWSLIGNEDFADIFVNKWAYTFSKANQIMANGLSVPISIFEIMLFYLDSWFVQLLQIKDIIEDTLMLVLSFKKVISNFIEGHYTQKNRLNTAKLYHLNFTLFELNLYYLYEYPKLTKFRNFTNREHIYKDFVRLLESFDIKSIDSSDVKYFAIDTVMDMSKINLQISEYVDEPQKLNQDNIMKYLEIYNELETFLNTLEDIPANQIADLFENPRFTPRETNLTMLDALQLDEVIPNLHYPYIEPIEIYSAAIRFFDKDLKLPEVVKGSGDSSKKSPPTNFTDNSSK